MMELISSLSERYDKTFNQMKETITQRNIFQATWVEKQIPFACVGDVSMVAIGALVNQKSD